MIVINRKQIYSKGIIYTLETVVEEISLMENGETKHNEQLYRDKEFLCNEYDDMASMKEDEVIVIGIDTCDKCVNTKGEDYDE